MQTSTRPELASDSLRFGFGKNWLNFGAHIDEDRIHEAERSLQEMLGVSSLEGTKFLDVGCGSGLFSLVACRLGASFVRAFDYDADSVAASARLREDSSISSERWTVERGDILDKTYVSELGQFDVVYAWGVLHHTGDLQRAMENTAAAVAAGGRLFIAIYNDQGRRSRMWRRVKRVYNRLPMSLRNAYVMIVMAPFELRSLAYSLIRLRPQSYIAGWTEYRRSRGMSRWHDLVDWVGGYPYEVATPQEVFDFYRSHGFTLQRLTTPNGLGCNEYVFSRP